ncbi:hypothetical protein GQR36_02965 [Enterococcus termitis]
MSNKYLKEATSIKLEVQDYVLNKSEQAIINKHEKALKELERINSDLQKLADKISEKK